MRKRHSFAILTMLGVSETVAASAEDYVEIAVRLGQDAAWRAQVQDRMRENAQRIYDDETPIRALESFLLRVSGRGSD